VKSYILILVIGFISTVAHADTGIWQCQTNAAGGDFYEVSNISQNDAFGKKLRECQSSDLVTSNSVDECIQNMRCSCSDPRYCKPRQDEDSSF